MSTYVVGLTGGIGSGKSEVASRFAEFGVDIIDADIIARQLVEPGMPAHKAISDHFGKQILLTDGRLDRSKLRELVFTDHDARQWLENLLHPHVRKAIRSRLEQSTSPYVILVVPLLLESGEYDFVDRILVVDAPVQTRIDRVRRRDNIEAPAVRAIMETQASPELRLSRADDVIHNAGPLDDLDTQIKKLHEFYIQQADLRHQTG